MPQLNGLSKQINGFNVVQFKGTELKCGVVVAENYPQHMEKAELCLKLPSTFSQPSSLPELINYSKHKNWCDLSLSALYILR